MDDKKKPKKEEQETLSGALERDHDGGILDNLGGIMKKNPKDGTDQLQNLQSKESLLDSDGDGNVMDDIGGLF